MCLRIHCKTKNKQKVRYFKKKRLTFRRYKQTNKQTPKQTSKVHQNIEDLKFWNFLF